MFMVAVNNNCLADVMKILARSTVDETKTLLSTVVRDGYNAVTTAAFSGNTDMLSTLLRAPGACSNSTGNVRFLPRVFITYCSICGLQQGDMTILDLLILDSPVTTRKSLTIAELLLKFRARPDGNGRRTGNYPLVTAVQFFHPTMAKLLLRYRADPNIFDTVRCQIA
jgi:hypothetical protein